MLCLQVNGYLTNSLLIMAFLKQQMLRSGHLLIPILAMLSTRLWSQLYRICLYS